VMDLSLIVAGIALLLLLACAAGGLQAEERAWRDVAEARRRNGEARQRVHELLDSFEKCRDCPFRPRPSDRDHKL
jgi:hypothetical protein